MRKERAEVLEDNERFIARGGKDSDSEEEGMVDSSDEDEEVEYQKNLKTLQKITKAKDELRKQGKDADADAEAEDDSDDSNDSDYEYQGGDLALYDSRLDDTDELIFVRDTLT